MVPKTDQPRTRTARLAVQTLIIAALLVVVPGCQDGPFTIVSVSGTVLYEDGEPIPSEEYRLRFVSQAESPDGKSFPRIATAIVNANGFFDAVTTHKYKDGLIKSEHVVYLQINNPDGAPLVPEAYLSSKTSPLRIDATQSRKIDIRIPRP